jgi:mannose-6-phosphate isomerase class I
MQVLSEAGAFTAPESGSGVHWTEHLRVSDLSVGTYSIAAGADDDQEPHTEDEIYVVTAGRGTLAAGGQTAPVGPGSVIYVPAVSRTTSRASPAILRPSCCSPRPSTPAPVPAADTNAGYRHDG